MITIKTSSFGDDLGGRYRKIGAKSAEEFRDDFVVPILRSRAGRVVIDFDSSYMFSFTGTEELAGGLVRLFGTCIAERVSIVTSTGNVQYAKLARTFMRQEIQRQPLRDPYVIEVARPRVYLHIRGNKHRVTLARNYEDGTNLVGMGRERVQKRYPCVIEPLFFIPSEVFTDE